MITKGGHYVIRLIETYGVSLPLLFIVLMQTVTVCWVYGVDRFCKNLEEMYGTRPGLFWRVCWKYISPTLLVSIFITACVQEFEKLGSLQDGGYTYPRWAIILGFIITSSSISCVPIYACYHFKTKTHGKFLEVSSLVSFVTTFSLRNQ